MAKGQFEYWVTSLFPASRGPFKEDRSASARRYIPLEKVAARTQGSKRISVKFLAST